MAKDQKTPHEVASEHLAVQRRLREEFYSRLPTYKPMLPAPRTKEEEDA